ncbi:MAG: class I SAM-dependent methyltransferase [Planctomycetota bacterium]
MSEPGYRGYREWKSWEAARFGEIRPEEGAYFDAELTKSGAGALAGKRVVEIGFGNGGFAQWARKNGADYAGTEVIPELQALGREAGIRVLDHESLLAAQAGAGTIDLIVAFDVFEHIEVNQLRVLLADLKACLRPGGRLIGRVPSGDSPFSRAIQHGDLTHRTAFGSSAILQLAMAAGFADVTTREPAFPLNGAGCLGAIRRMMVRAARSVLYPLISRVLMGGGRPVLTPNMVFVLRRS